MKKKSAARVLNGFDNHYAKMPLRLIKGGKGDEADLVIEGFANKAVIDRGGDLIPPKAWMLEEFKDNPIIFFNHNRDLPIGRAISVKVTEDGLIIRVLLSNSDSEFMKHIRTLIKEGILKTFSVGFDPMDSEEKADEGHNVINKANLLEVSIVSLPMNQESTFDVAKVIDIDSWKTKTYSEVKREVMSVMKKSRKPSKKKRSKKVQKIQSKEMVKSESGPASDGMQHTHTLEYDTETGKGKTLSTDGLDSPHSHKIEEFKMLEDIEGGHTHKISLPKSAIALFTKATSAKGLMKVYNRLVVKGLDPEALMEEMHSRWHTLGNPCDEEDEDKGGDEDDEEKLEGEDFQNCVTGKIPKFIDEGMEQDEAVAAAISHCREKSDGTCEVSKEDMKTYIELADKHSSKGDDEDEDEEDDEEKKIDYDEEDEDEEKDEKDEDDEDDEDEEDKGKGKSKSDETDFGSPQMDLMKSQLSLTGSLVQTMKEMLEVMRDLNSKTAPTADSKMDEDDEEDEEDKGSDEDEDEEKSLELDRREKILDNFSDRLSKLMV